LVRWTGIGRVDPFDPKTTNELGGRPRFIFGGARWSHGGQVGDVETFENESAVRQVEYETEGASVRSSLEAGADWAFRRPGRIASA